MMWDFTRGELLTVGIMATTLHPPTSHLSPRCLYCFILRCDCLSRIHGVWSLQFLCSRKVSRDSTDTNNDVMRVVSHS